MMRIPNARYYFVGDKEYFEIPTKNGAIIRDLSANISKNCIPSLKSILRFLNMPIGIDTKKSKLDRINVYLLKKILENAPVAPNKSLPMVPIDVAPYRVVV